MEGRKTTDAQRRAYAKYSKTIERINARFPVGTKDRITKLGYSSINAFILQAVMERLEKEERRAK